MALTWNFWRGWGVQAKKPSVGGVWIFSGTTQFDTVGDVGIHQRWTLLITNPLNCWTPVPPSQNKHGVS